MNLWNWLRRRKQPAPLRFGTLREVADEAGVHSNVKPLQARKQPPSLVGPDVQVRPLLVGLPMNTQVARMSSIDELRAERQRRMSHARMLEIDETARAAWEQQTGYWDGSGQSDSGDEWDGGGAA